MSVDSFGFGVFRRARITGTRISNSTPVTIKCKPGSKAIEYARLNNLNVERA
jgi:hypothetical protein